MTLNKILSIGGKPGLYALISHAKGHIIVESLEDKKRFPVAGAQQINTLDNIAIYTLTKEIPLSYVLFQIYTQYKGQPILSHQESNANLMAFFEGVLPDYDAERVYPSNVKKVVQWYNILQKNDFDFTALNPDNQTDKTTDAQPE